MRGGVPGQSSPRQNADVPQELRIEFRIGIHVGDIIIDDDDISAMVSTSQRALRDSPSRAGSAYLTTRTGKFAASSISPSMTSESSSKKYSRTDASMAHRVAGETPPAVPIKTVSCTVQVLELPDKPSIVVLPFDNMSAEAGQEYLADGIVEAITASLSCIRSFFVIARSSAFTYKGRATNARDIGKELGVAYLLEGSVQKAGNRLRIIVQLIETEGGAHTSGVPASTRNR